MQRILWLAIILAIGAIIAGFQSVDSINRLPVLDETVAANWAQVENQYQRRADLVPNLVATVKGYATHEADVLTAVTEARAKVGQMTVPKDIVSNEAALRAFEQNQAVLSQALSRLLVVVERYPNLKADQSFLSLQSQLEGTENRIAVARRDFIVAVKAFNTEIRTIPGRWWAAMIYPDLEPKQTFASTPAASQAPQVKFNN